ncbi:hypothetical protein D3C87_77940 [compost metagenome]
MAKHAGSPLFERLSLVLKRVDEDQKVELLVSDFDKLTYGKYERRHQTLLWRLELKRQVATFRTYYHAGMSSYKPLSDISVRILSAINAIEEALTDCYTNPNIIDTMKEVKLVLEEEYSYMLVMFELTDFEEIS